MVHFGKADLETGMGCRNTCGINDLQKGRKNVRNVENRLEDGVVLK